MSLKLRLTFKVLVVSVGLLPEAWGHVREFCSSWLLIIRQNRVQRLDGSIDIKGERWKMLGLIPRKL